MRKLFYMGTLLFSVGVLAAGCGNSETADSSGNESADGKTTLDFWSFWGSGARQEVIEEIIDDFNASQDKIEVKYSYQPWGDIWTKSLSSITAGNPPDVIVQDINSVAQRAEAQQATNLSEYIEEGFSDEFYPQLWDTVEYEGDAYAVPFNTDTQVIFYNKTLFKEAGISEEQLPQTWEELETVARKLDVQNGDDFEFGVIQIPEKESGSGHWSWGGGFVLEVPYGAKDPEASYEFIKYLSTPEVQEKFGEKSFDIMANRTANENLVNNDNLDENGQMIYQMADENFANTVITPVPLTAPDFSSLVNEQIDQIMLGSKTPAEGLADAQKAVEDLVEQNK
jgi:ABC-type glycerol-3-phosphate transport system substrate-binding protein